jgi:hypothetical protein
MATAGEGLANDAGVGFVFAAELDSGRTWSYLKQGGVEGDAAGVWTGGSDLNPFDEYDEGSSPLDPASLATPPPRASFMLQDPASGSPPSAARDALAGAEDPSTAAGSPPASGEMSGGLTGEELARRLGGRFAGGRIVIHGDAAKRPDTGGDSGGEAGEDAGEESAGAWADPWADPAAGADPLLEWLEGAPLLCSPLPPRCGARE